MAKRKKAKKKAKPKAAAVPKKQATKVPKRQSDADQLGVLGTEKLFGVVRERTPCGSTAVDAIMGGGVPVGRVIEVVGGYSTGKSTWVEGLAAQVQKGGGDVAMGLSEATIDPTRMARIGVDCSKVRFKEFEFIEDGFEWVENTLNARKRTKSGYSNIQLVTWDTIGGAHSRDERPGSGARVVRQGLRRIVNLVAEKRTILVFVNQTSATFDRFAIEPAAPFSGGVRFHASIRLEFQGFRRFDEESMFTPPTGEMEKKAPVGIMPIVVCRKNKTAPPFRKCRMPITFDGGLDDDFSIFLYLQGTSQGTKAHGMTLRSPDAKKGEEAGRGRVVNFWIPDEPAATYENVVREFLAQNPHVKKWARQQCFNLAKRGYNPIG